MTPTHTINGRDVHVTVGAPFQDKRDFSVHLTDSCARWMHGTIMRDGSVVFRDAPSPPPVPVTKHDQAEVECILEELIE